ncbi:phosphotransferase [Paenibacillus sp. L3-i20]|uniref:phosphotransferase n=1 Tax=Paenibacillus sp. L3-i20 TaxID=2905833 RepID=UPI001EE10CC5|nr:phosphotransferase [Paenibacillus sp. L3-i20]GKU78420.1 hypothetical protein L3i20_v228170 [Paenibacillus sp. L3-i20]
MEPIIYNHSKLPIENKIEQLYGCLSDVFGEKAIERLTITCDHLSYDTLNFTTSGIFHLHGFASIMKERLPWSIIVKVIKSDSAEKDQLEHHNYWRREALIFESKLLDELPDCIQAPKSYLVEEQQDGTIWLWMEHIVGQYACSQHQFNFIARQLGRFNGAYLNGRELPKQEWICREWLKSWTTASQIYAPKSEAYIERLDKDNERSIWTWFQSFSQQLESNVSSLAKLPRVLAHQDLSQMNMLLVQDHNNKDGIVLIDWQFMSISGVGEDLGKMFGLTMGLGIIPSHQYDALQSSLFDAYMLGLRDMGWQGDERLARYGFCLATALRSVWEVPVYFSLAAQLQKEPHNTKLQVRVDQLEQIIAIHRVMSVEADKLRALIM